MPAPSDSLSSILLAFSARFARLRSRRDEPRDQRQRRAADQVRQVVDDVGDEQRERVGDRVQVEHVEDAHRGDEQHEPEQAARDDALDAGALAGAFVDPLIDLQRAEQAHRAGPHHDGDQPADHQDADRAGDLWQIPLAWSAAT